MVIRFLKQFYSCLKLCLVLFIAFTCTLEGRAQPGNISPVEAENHVHHRHRLSLGLGHAHIPAGIKGGEKKWLNLGAYALDYDFMFTEKWSAGIHTDIVPTTYEVEIGNSPEDLLVRRSPLAAVLLGTYKVTPHLGFQAGFGWEITREESLTLIRLGAEYGWEIGQQWEIGIGLSYDRKVEEYDTWFLGFMVSRWMGKPIQQHSR